MQKLHALRLPVRTLPVDELRWHLSWKAWSNYGAPFQVSPAEVRRDPDRFALHYERTMAADLAFALHVIRWEGRWTILDGLHRLLKADILGYKDVLVSVVEPEQLPTIMVPPPEEAMVMLRQFFEGNPREDSVSPAGAGEDPPEDPGSPANARREETGDI